MREHIHAGVAEFIGTFCLVFFGCGAILIDQNSSGVFGLQGIALAFGLIIIAVIYAIGHISGAHINPAVTFALACVRKFPWCRVPTYMIAQFLGATVASLLLSVCIATGPSLGMTMPAGDPIQALVIEIILTALLLFVVKGVGIDTRAHSQFTAIAVSAVIMIDIMVGGSISGASMNPARSFGPALISMNFDHLWIYFVGPVVGGVIGALLYLCCSFRPRR